MKANNDHFLIQQTLQGNQKAFVELINQYKDLVFTLSMRSNSRFKQKSGVTSH